MSSTRNTPISRHTSDPPKRIQSVLNNCPQCNKEAKSSCVQCFVCSCWFHINCAKISTNLFNLINSEGHQFEFFCENCLLQKEQIMNYVKSTLFAESLKCQSVNEIVSEFCDEIKNKINNVKTVVVERNTELISDFDKVKSTVVNINSEIVNNCKEVKTKFDHINPTVGNLNKPLLFKDVVFKKKNCAPANKDSNQVSLATSSVEPQMTNHFMFVKGISPQLFKNSISFKFALSQEFPNRQLVKCYLKNNGIINVLFQNESDLNYVQSNWQRCLKIFPNSSAITLNQLKSEHTKSEKLTIILRDVPSFFSEAEMLNSFKKKYPSVLALEKFKKNENHNLPVAKLVLTSLDEYNEILQCGLFHNNFFCRTEKYISLKKPLICYNCCRIGHGFKHCRSSPNCIKCSENHHSDQCTSTNFKCFNCNGCHKSSDILCPVYQNVLAKNNNISN